MLPHVLIGSTLREAAATSFVSRAGDVREAVSFHLRFDSAGWVEIRGLSWGLQWTPDVAPAGYEMAELGKVIVQDMTNEAPFNDAIGRRIASVELLLVPESQDPIGVVLRCEGSKEVLIFNWGDVLIATARWPQYLVDARATTGPAG